MSTSEWESFEALCEQAQQPESQLVYLIDEMLRLLLALGGACKRFIYCKEVGIHKANRDGLGVVDESVHGNGVGIDSNGFVRKACEEARCFEDDDDHSNTKFTCDICNDEPSLATFALGWACHGAVPRYESPALRSPLRHSFRPPRSTLLARHVLH